MNDNGPRLIDFCQLNDLVIGGPLFQYKDIHKAMWTTPNGIVKNQIDYFCIRRKFRRSLLDVWKIMNSRYQQRPPAMYCKNGNKAQIKSKEKSSSNKETGCWKNKRFWNIKQIQRRTKKQSIHNPTRVNYRNRMGNYQNRLYWKRHKNTWISKKEP